MLDDLIERPAEAEEEEEEEAEEEALDEADETDNDEGLTLNFVRHV